MVLPGTSFIKYAVLQTDLLYFIQRCHRVACTETVQIEKGLGVPNKYFATQNGLCIYEDTACRCYEASQRAFQI